jgi:2,4-dienoyl-CoA reductase-like NADH-dependent reductase (Old Yellow Enzyme family)
VSDSRYVRVATLKNVEAFRSHLAAQNIELGFDETLLPRVDSPLARPLNAEGVQVGNRFCILPMEGWDGTTEGTPTDLTRRRWQHFGESGAKLIWGGEAVAVCHEGRANPHQLMLTGETQSSLEALRETLVASHRERFGAAADGDLYLGLQLTHSGRFARPTVWNRPEPLVAYAHPVLDRRVGNAVRVLSDDELDRIVDHFVRAARQAYDIGFQFVDIKHCHGYLGHELLSARERTGRYGGTLENRTRFLFNIVRGIRAAAPGLQIGVRLSVLDSVPYRKSADGSGVPEVEASTYRHGFGLLGTCGVNQALDDARGLLPLLEAAGIRWVCVTAGSPYYCPHVVRPALFPPSDGYEPPEDPLHGVARQIDATSRLKAEFPGIIFVGSAYTYLQEWLPNVAQYTVGHGMTDFVGLGRIVLSYPDLPADVLAGRTLARRSICRTFSDCTTGPRFGLVSGCYPLDPAYAKHPQAAALKEAKASARA